MDQPRIVILSGSEASRVIPIPPNGLTFGRAADNDICINDPLASKHHFSLKPENEQMMLHDGDTPNGTFVDGIARIEWAVKGGERIQYGSTAILYVCGDASPDSWANLIDDEADRTRNLMTLRVREPVSDKTAAYRRDAADLFRKVRATAVISDLDELQVQILGFAFAIIPAYRGAILLNNARVNPDPRDIHSRICRDRDFKGPIDFPVSRKILEHVYTDLQPLRSDEAPPILCVPLIVRGRMRGVLYLEGHQQSRAFEDEDLDFLEAFGQHAVLGIRLSEQFGLISTDLDNVKSARTYKFEMKGQSEGMKRVQHQMKKAAADPTCGSVLIIGETGTGKEGVARGIHEMSARAERPLITFDCGNAHEASFVQSQLFGHVKGGYTGAIEARKGKLQEADKSTIFFDEVGEFPLSLQQSLLRALQEREFEAVGSNKPIKVDVRVICATKVDLEDAVRNNKFRDDLFHRLNTYIIVVPPLRERRDDIPLLAEHFLWMYGAHRPGLSIAPEVMDIFISYDWPGNVRELQQTIRRAIIDVETDVIAVENLPPSVSRQQSRSSNNSGKSLNEIARRAADEARENAIIDSLAKNGNNVQKTADQWSVTRQYVYSILARKKKSAGA